jgi:hypothetical protein
MQAIEDAFGIRVSEDDLRGMRTLDDLCSFLRSQKGDRSRAQLERATVSYRLLLGLGEACGIAPSAVTDDTNLDAIFPRGKRQAQWQALEDAAQLNLPSLTHPRWFAIGLLAFFLISMGLAVGFFWTGWSTGQRLFALIATPFWPFMLWWMALYFSRGLARSFPHDCQTFGDLVNDVVHINPTEPPAGSRAEVNEALADDDFIWKLLQALIALETGRSIEDVSPQTQISEIF